MQALLFDLTTIEPRKDIKLIVCVPVDGKKSSSEVHQLDIFGIININHEP